MLTRLLVRGLLGSQPPRPVWLGLNVHLEGLKGLRVTHPGRPAYADAVQVGDEGHGRGFWISRSRPRGEEEGTDIGAVRNGYASLTPWSPTSPTRRGCRR